MLLGGGVQPPVCQALIMTRLAREGMRAAGQVQGAVDPASVIIRSAVIRPKDQKNDLEFRASPTLETALLPPLELKSKLGERGAAQFSGKAPSRA